MSSGGDVSRDQELVEDIKEGMQELDIKLKEIEEFNNKNYKIDPWFLLQYQSLFTKMDQFIISRPYVKYTKDNLPDYYPENGIWFN